MATNPLAMGPLAQACMEWASGVAERSGDAKRSSWLIYGLVMGAALAELDPGALRAAVQEITDFMERGDAAVWGRTTPQERLRLAYVRTAEKLIERANALAAARPDVPPDAE
jgi:hypothetical protein